MHKPTLAIRVLCASVLLTISTGCSNAVDINPETNSSTPSQDCTPGYSPCLPELSDYDCKGGQGDGPGYTGRVEVTGTDPYKLDRDRDGFAC
jgi:hypothetical protein